MSSDHATAGLHTHAFYWSGLGNRLIDKGNYPPSIHDYLRDEERLLGSLEDGFSILVEVGCMHGRYLEWAISRGKHYLGIDPVRPYIRKGEERLTPELQNAGACRFVQGAAEEIDLVLEQQGITADQRPLLFFPFNSFGQTRVPRAIVAALSRAGTPFLICTYRTDHQASEVRQQYYDACSYSALRQISDEDGVRFESDDGFYSAAYHGLVMARMLAAAGIHTETVGLSDIGVAYLSLQSSCGGTMT